MVSRESFLPRLDEEEDRDRDRDRDLDEDRGETEQKGTTEATVQEEAGAGAGADIPTESGERLDKEVLQMNLVDNIGGEVPGLGWIIGDRSENRCRQDILSIFTSVLG